MIPRAVLLCSIGIPLFAIDDAVAQTGAVVSGRVVERGSTTGIPGATLTVAGRRPFATDAAGAFRMDLPSGRLVLQVGALGYAEREITFELARDTSLVIVLDPAPIMLDSLTVRGRTLTVLGHVRESGTGSAMIHVDVLTSAGETTRTNAGGRFKLEKFPAGLEEEIRVRELGYLQASLMLTTERDTSVSLELQPDPLAQRMIDVQVERLERRSRPFRSLSMPAIGREDLLQLRNGTVLDVIQHRYGYRVRGFQCIVIDEQQNDNGLDGLTMIYPEEVERIEVVSRGGMMLRIYTRRFITKMMAGGVELARPVYAPGRLRPLCR